MAASSKPLSLLCVVPCGLCADAWPIEVAWGFASGEVRSMLLKPCPDWPLAAWDKSREARHRIGLEKLLHEGKSPLDACLVLNAALGQSDVASATPEEDSVWLYKLYRAAGVGPNYTLRPLEGGEPAPFVRAEQGVRALQQRVLSSQAV